jgi:galactose mutarotase-like enzyme
MRNDQGLVEIRSNELSASINPRGAELYALTASDGRALLWNGDPNVWSGRAPLLFPIVGMLNGGRYRTGGRAISLEKHGFARRRWFSVVSKAEDVATFRLAADAESLSLYPFAFALELEFRVTGPVLSMTATVRNEGIVPMPASFGFHPAFSWPLPGGGARDGHRLIFARREPAPIRRINGNGVVRPEFLPTPVVDRVLTLADDLFEDDAIIFDSLQSASLDYLGPSGGGLRIGFADTPLLGVWTKPSAPFICVEPWSGLADPEGFEGDIFEKPWIFALAPGEARTFVMTVETLPISDG